LSSPENGRSDDAWHGVFGFERQEERGFQFEQRLPFFTRQPRMAVFRRQIESRIAAVKFERFSHLRQLRQRRGVVRQAARARRIDRVALCPVVFASVSAAVIAGLFVAQKDHHAFGLQRRLQLGRHRSEQAWNLGRREQRLGQIGHDLLRVVSLPEELAVNHRREIAPVQPARRLPRYDAFGSRNQADSQGGWAQILEQQRQQQRHNEAGKEQRQQN
jgi:hypothetical protein